MKKIILLILVATVFLLTTCKNLWDFEQLPLNNIADPSAAEYIDRLTVTAVWEDSQWDGAVFGE